MYPVDGHAVGSEVSLVTIIPFENEILLLSALLMVSESCTTAPVSHSESSSIPANPSALPLKTGCCSIAFSGVL